MIVLASETYGSEGTSSQGTWEELIFAKEKKKPLFVIRMCSEFKEEGVEMELMKLQMPVWTPKENMPENVWTGLIDVLQQEGIIKKEEAAAEKAVHEKAATAKVAAERAAAEKATAERAAAEKAAAEKAAAEKAAAEKAAAERAAAEKAAAEKAAAEKAATERAAAEKAAAELAAAERVAADRARSQSSVSNDTFIIQVT